MANKVSLANKYRPQTFSEVSEQNSIKTILENQIKNDNLKHAYLFCGGAGTGKTTTARIIAQLMNEGKGRTIEMDCASNNGVDSIRDIQEQCLTRPIGCKYKIFLLDECHMLSQAAWNSMLKILEEPPEYVIFLLCTTDPQKIIGTIMSRVQRFNFSRISTKGITERLKFILSQENITDYEQSAVEYIARLAKGGMRDAITTLEKCLDYNSHLTLQSVSEATSGGVTEQTMLELLRACLNKQTDNVLLQFNDIYMSGIEISLFLKLFIEFLENCIKYIITRNSEIVMLSDLALNWLDEHPTAFDPMAKMLDEAINIKTTYTAEDLRVIIESWLIKTCM